MKKEYNIKKNTLFYYAQFIISSVAVVIISPILVSNLGSQNFGLWKLCQKIMDFASFADGRSSQALKTMLAIEEGKNSSIDKKCQMLGAAIKTWIYYVPVLLMVCSGLVLLAPELVKDSDQNSTKIIYIISSVMALNVILSPIFGIPDATLMAIGKSYKSSMVQILGVFISTGLMFFLSTKENGIILIALTVAGVSLFNGGVSNFIVNKEINWYKFKKPDNTVFKNFLNFSGLVLLWSGVEKLLLSIDVFLIGYYCGTEYLTKYTFNSYSFQLAAVICLLGTSAVVPVLSTAYGENNELKLKELVKIIRKKVFIIGSLFSFGIIGFNELFVNLWVGNNLYIENSIDILLAINLMQLVVLRAEGQMLDACQKIKSKILLVGISIAISCLILFCLSFLRQISINNVIIAIIVGRIPAMLLLPRYVNINYGINNFPVSVYMKFTLILIIIMILTLQFKNSFYVEYLIASALAGMGLVFYIIKKKEI